MRSSSSQSVIAALTILFAPIAVQTAQGYTVVGDPNNPAGLQAAIQNVYNSGATGVTVQPGVYNIPASAGDGGAHVIFTNMTHAFVIDAPNVELSFGGTKDGVYFGGCQNVTFRGAKLHYYEPYTGQGKITALGSDANGAYYDVQVDAGYTAPFDWTTCYVVDSSTRRFKYNTYDFYGNNGIDQLGGGKIRIHWGGTTGLPSSGWNVAVNDYLVCRGPGNTLLHDDSCTNCTFQGVTLYWGGGFGFFDTNANGNHFLDDIITYGPTPSGGSNAPLLSQSADGLHSAGAVKGPDIQGCLFEGMGDDGIAVHGSHENVTAVSGNQVTVDGLEWNVSDPVRLADSVGHYGDAVVNAITQIDSGHWKLTLDRTIALTIGSGINTKASNPNRNGPNFTLFSNVIRNNRARGMLLKGDNGSVMGNILDGNTLSGVSIGPEYGWGKGEADYVTGLYIAGNTFLSNSSATGNVGYNGAILIHGEGAEGNKNITITGNHFDSVYGANIIVQWANGVSITNNSFADTNQVAIGDPTIVSLSNANGVSFSGNTVYNQGSFGTSYYLSSAGVTSTSDNGSGFSYSDAKVYEAENAVLNDCSVGTDSTASGGHTARLIVNADSYVKFTVNVQNAGTYPVLAYYDNGNTSASIPALATWNASVNGGGSTQLMLPYTFGWNTFSQTHVVAFMASLNAGANTIQFNCGRSSADMDKIVVLSPQSVNQSSFYRLFCQNSGKVLAVVNAATNSGAPIQQFTDNGTPDHNW